MRVTNRLEERTTSRKEELVCKKEFSGTIFETFCHLLSY